MVFRDSIVALSSGRLPSGIAVVRMSGPEVRFVLETTVGSVPRPRFATLREIKSLHGSVDTGLVLFFPGPDSFTGEDTAEFQVHGGRAVVDALLEALTRHEGVRLAEPGEFTLRAFLNGRIDLLAAEALADLINADTEAQRRWAIANAGGVQRDLYAQWRTRLLQARAILEAELDFSDEGDVASRTSPGMAAELDGLAGEIEAHAAQYRRAEIVRDGFEVVILGPPNAGKSSLINALARRDVAIVADSPGTTRDLIEVFLDLEGLKVRIVDTAGIREATDTVETIGISRALIRAREADLVLLLDEAFGDGPEMLLPHLPPQSVLRVGTKADLGQGLHGKAFNIVVSTLTNQGLDQLMSMIGRRAVEAVGSSLEVLPSRLRHVELLGSAASHLRAAASLDEHGLELQAEELRIAGEELGRIIGDVGTEDILGAIFSQFCIGK